MTQKADNGEITLLAGESGYALLTDPNLNKGTAFTDDERARFALHGLLPPHVSTLSEQVKRRIRVIRALCSDLERYVYLRELQDTNETLFYALLTTHLDETLPIIYTPTVGPGCQQFSRLFRRPRGVFLSFPLKDQMRKILANPRFDLVETVVVTDGERVLGLGDQGVGGMGIAIGKAALYTSCAGLHPSTTLPILLDVGTDNEECLNDPLYLGWRHPRVRGDAYDDFIEQFVTALHARWPDVLLQWEDFARHNASRLLAKYRDRLCTFNDDIQGTAAAAVGTVLSALNVSGSPLADQRICIFGAGSAGCGIASLLLRALREAGHSQESAQRCLFMVDREGLLLESSISPLEFQKPFLHPDEAISGWTLTQPTSVDFYDTISNARPTILIGVSGQPGAFSERVIRRMADLVHRPIILPLSNPSSHSEAKPQELQMWTGGRAVIGVGSPFPPLNIEDRLFVTDQANNSYIFPGVGLGVVASRARRISDGMFMAAAKAMAELSPAVRGASGNFLPPVSSLREVAMHVALAVGRTAQREGLAPHSADLKARVKSRMWTPAYRTYHLPSQNC
jgi:malate dehydrogenase (oxaloacetate-decarboxylating)